ncbi:hypothetical protein OQA88_6952 [Cercophora sp. LCS_1]
MTPEGLFIDVHDEFSLCVGQDPTASENPDVGPQRQQRQVNEEGGDVTDVLINTNNAIATSVPPSKHTVLMDLQHPLTMMPPIPQTTESTTTATPLNILPHILLPILLLIAYIPPPSRFRAPIFVTLLVLLQWRCTVSPWPLNTGESRALRYGLSTSWLFVLPVLQRLTVNTPERDFWRVDDVPKPPVGPETEPARPPPPKEWSGPKVRWAINLFSTPRGVGWNFGGRGVNAQRESIRKDNAEGRGKGKVEFVVRCLGRAARSYLVWDGVMLAVQKAVIPDGWAWNWLTIGRIGFAEVLMLLVTWCGMTMQFELVTAPCLGFSRWINQRLHIPRRSPVAYAVHLVTAFAISAFFHTLSLAAVSPGYYPVRDLVSDMSIFFMLQPIATMAEMMVMAMFARYIWAQDSNGRRQGDNRNKQQDQAVETTSNERPSRPFCAVVMGRELLKRNQGIVILSACRFVGYAWVVSWFWVTAWWFVKAYTGVRMQEWQLPFSVLGWLLIPRR